MNGCYNNFPSRLPKANHITSGYLLFKAVQILSQNLYRNTNYQINYKFEKLGTQNEQFEDELISMRENIIKIKRVC